MKVLDLLNNLNLKDCLDLKKEVDKRIEYLRATQKLDPDKYSNFSCIPVKSYLSDLDLGRKHDGIGFYGDEKGITNLVVEGSYDKIKSMIDKYKFTIIYFRQFEPDHD